MEQQSAQGIFSGANICGQEGGESGPSFTGVAVHVRTHFEVSSLAEVGL